MSGKRYKIGNRIIANTDIDITLWDPEDGVAAGDHGEIIDVDPETGDVTILMDRAIPALVDCRNYLFVQADHLCRIRRESEGSLAQLTRIIGRPAAITFAAAAAFLLVLSFGSIGRQTNHPHAYQNRFSTSPSVASAAPPGCHLP